MNENNKTLFARFDDKDPARQQELQEHFDNVTQDVTNKAPSILKEGATLVAQLHDKGKETPKWQDYLEAKRQGKSPAKVEHSIVGAKLLHQTLPYKNMGKLLAYPIAGHHVGLPNGEGSGSLTHRLEDYNKELPPLTENLPALDVFKNEILQGSKRTLGYSFYIRLLFSLLVDGDRTDAANFEHKEEFNYDKLSTLLNKFNIYYNEKNQNAPQTDLNRQRKNIYDRCMQASQEKTGLFSLTVPTGGGKTLSSLAFALNHALKNGQQRVIYVAPFMSIIDQTASEYNTIFGETQVLAHYSNNDFLIKDNEDDYLAKEDRRAIKASENWDCPLIVTTAVQFWQSLFTHKTTPARKVHNMTNAVIIFDEIQTLPPEYLHPLLETMKELVAYNSTLVLCTATQPAITCNNSYLKDEKGNNLGLQNVTEIVENPQELAQYFERVTVKDKGKLNQEELAEKLTQYPQVLCIVDDRKTAANLYNFVKEATGNEGVFHLSALMFPAHRKAKIEEIKQKLKNNQKIILISTSLIEAGVDVDFPVVYRSIAGLDHLVQSAGRCNRHNSLGYRGGKFYYFTLSDKKIAPFRQPEVDSFKAVSRHFQGNNLFSLKAMDEYFKYWYTKAKSYDDKGIIGFLKNKEGTQFNFQFRDAGESFKLIEEDNTVSVLIPYNKEITTVIDKIKTDKANKTDYRKLGQYSVGLYHNEFKKLQTEGAIEALDSEGQLFCLAKTVFDYYKEDLGLTVTLSDEERDKGLNL